MRTGAGRLGDRYTTAAPTYQDMSTYVGVRDSVTEGGCVDYRGVFIQVSVFLLVRLFLLCISFGCTVVTKFIPRTWTIMLHKCDAP